MVLLLMIVIVAAFLLLSGIGGRSIADRCSWSIALVALLLVAGTVGAWIVALMYENAETNAMGPAVL